MQRVGNTSISRNMRGETSSSGRLVWARRSGCGRGRCSKSRRAWWVRRCADSASCATVNRFVGIIAGNGGLAWNTQLWPHPGQATVARRAFYATGQGDRAGGAARVTTR